MKEEHCDASETIKKSGLAKTAQRMAVLEAFSRANHPLSATEILALTAEKTKIKRVTVYRILRTFRDRGIIREIEMGLAGSTG